MSVDIVNLSVNLVCEHILALRGKVLEADYLLFSFVRFLADSFHSRKLCSHEILCLCRVADLVKFRIRCVLGTCKIIAILCDQKRVGKCLISISGFYFKFVFDKI